MTARDVAWLIVIGFGIYVMVTVREADQSHKEKLAKATDPTDVVALLIGAGASAPEVTRNGASLAVAYTVERPWDGAAVATISSTDTIKLVPEIFRRFSDIGEINIRVRAPFQDIRGNQSEKDAVKIAFSRANAGAVQWANILPQNISKVADHYWAHPSIARSQAARGGD